MFKFLKVIIVLIVIAGVAYTAAWYYMGGKIKGAITTQEEALKVRIHVPPYLAFQKNSL